MHSHLGPIGPRDNGRYDNNPNVCIDRRNTLRNVNVLHEGTIAGGLSGDL